MRADEATRSALEWEALGALVAGFSSAPLAQRALAAWTPCADLAAARAALAEVAEGMAWVAQSGTSPAPFVEDQARTLAALGAVGAVVEGPALISAAHTLESVRRLAGHLQRQRDHWPVMADRFRTAPAEPALEQRLLGAFDAEARLVDGASPELGSLRHLVRRTRADLVERLSRLIGGLPHVLVAADSRPTVRDGRYVVPLRREAVAEVPGIVHDESASGATVFLEPHAVVEQNNALRQAELAVGREEERILRELTALLAGHRDALEHAARLALHAETVLARARYAVAVGGHPPALGGSALALVEARHPLLLARAGAEGREIVPLTVELAADERALVVTGPNTGGKTVLLKTVGAVVLMAQRGIVPPVGPGTRLPWHAAVFADIGDAQSIAEDLSTFTAHLTRLKAASDGAAADTLILVDEIGASTDPAEGAALAAALIEAWTARGARTLVTTHYHALKALAAAAPGLVNGSLAYDVERNRPLYRFVKGVPGRSFGLELAARWGFGEPIIARARAQLDAGVLDLDAVTERLAAEELGFVAARRALDEERRAIGDAESARARRLTAEASARREAAERRLSELESQLERLRGEVRRQQRTLRERTVALTEAEAAARTAQVLATEAERAAEALRAERAALRAERLAPPLELGARVRIPRFDVTGEVVELDRGADVCAVQAGAVRITCQASECEVIAPSPSPLPATGADGAAATEADPELPTPIVLDLRGMTADEVAFPVAGAIERGYHSGRPEIRIIHGKGGGVLRARVAEVLRTHSYVETFRLGHWDEGGDGVTHVTLIPSAGG